MGKKLTSTDPEMIEWAKSVGKYSYDVVGRGPVANNLGRKASRKLREGLGLGVGDACFFVAGQPKDVYKFAACPHQNW